MSESIYPIASSFSDDVEDLCGEARAEEGRQRSERQKSKMISLEFYGIKIFLLFILEKEFVNFHLNLGSEAVAMNISNLGKYFAKKK